MAQRRVQLQSRTRNEQRFLSLVVLANCLNKRERGGGERHINEINETGKYNKEREEKERRGRKKKKRERLTIIIFNIRFTCAFYVKDTNIKSNYSSMENNRFETKKIIKLLYVWPCDVILQTEGPLQWR